MLKEQRARWPDFLQKIERIKIEEGLSKVAEILKVREDTIRRWIKGKENGGTEPTSDDFDRHEQRISSYIKMKDAKMAIEQEVDSGETAFASKEENVEISANEDPEEELKEIDIEEILPNPYQPRKVFQEEAIGELAASMDTDGLIQPIVVRRTDEGLMLVAGERRLRAAKKLGWAKIKAIVRRMDEKQAAAASIIENFQRVQNNPIEIADAIANLIERTGVTQTDVAQMLGVTQPKVAQIVSLTRLINPIKDLIAEEKLSPSVGRIIAVLDKDTQNRLLSSLENMTAERAQYFVNCYKGIQEIGSADESDNLEVRLFQKLYRAGYVDVYKSAWSNLNNKGFKSIASKNIKGIYFHLFDFDDHSGLDKLLKKVGIQQSWFHNDKKIEFDLISYKKSEATEFLLEELRKLAEQIKNDEVQKSGLTHEERVERAKNRLQIIKSTFEDLRRQAAGTPFEISIDEGEKNVWAVICALNLNLTESNVNLDLNNVEKILDDVEEWCNTQKKMLTDSNRAKSLNILKSAFEKVESSKKEYAGTPFETTFGGLAVKISHTLVNQANYDSWDLFQTASKLSKEVSDTVDAAQFHLVSATAEEDANEDAQGSSIEIPVLNKKPEKTKTGRILQILQEQTEELHDISVRCEECRNFNPSGSTYAERCLANASFHNFKRFIVDGKTAFNCSTYTPKREVIERKKSEANIDPVMALFELMIYKDGYGREYPWVKWLEEFIPELRGKEFTVQEVVELFKEQDEKTRAYWIEIFYRRQMLTEVVQKNKAHPFYTACGQRYLVDHYSMEKEDRI